MLIFNYTWMEAQLGEYQNTYSEESETFQKNCNDMEAKKQDFESAR